jgi:hypothetical protein
MLFCDTSELNSNVNRLLRHRLQPSGNYVVVQPAEAWWDRQVSGGRCRNKCLHFKTQWTYTRLVKECRDWVNFASTLRHTATGLCRVRLVRLLRVPIQRDLNAAVQPDAIIALHSGVCIVCHNRDVRDVVQVYKLKSWPRRTECKLAWFRWTVKRTLSICYINKIRILKLYKLHKYIICKLSLTHFFPQAWD